jgi:hypothetical protein
MKSDPQRLDMLGQNALVASLLHNSTQSISPVSVGWKSFVENRVMHTINGSWHESTSSNITRHFKSMKERIEKVVQSTPTLSPLPESLFEAQCTSNCSAGTVGILPKAKNFASIAFGAFVNVSESTPCQEKKNLKSLLSPSNFDPICWKIQGGIAPRKSLVGVRRMNNALKHAKLTIQLAQSAYLTSIVLGCNSDPIGNSNCFENVSFALFGRNSTSLDQTPILLTSGEAWAMKTHATHILWQISRFSSPVDQIIIGFQPKLHETTTSCLSRIYLFGEDGKSIVANSIDHTSTF